MKLEVGQVFWLEVFYPKTGETEVRPVAIIDFNDGIPVFVTFVTLTHSEIKDMNGKYDKWKVPLFKGKQVGLGNNSFAKVNCIAEVESASFTNKNYITKLDRVDFINIHNKVIDFLESGEEPW